MRMHCVVVQLLQFVGEAPFLLGCWCRFLEDIDDLPLAANLREVHVVDPLMHDRLGRGGIAVDVVNVDRRSALLGWRWFARP